MNGITIEKELHLAAPKAMVWEFLTRADKVAEWFNRPDQDMAEGREIAFAERGSGEVLCWGTVEQMVPCIFMSWRFSVKPAPDLNSLVEWRLEDEHGGTRLRLSHSGLPDTVDGIGLARALDKGWHDFLSLFYRCF